MTPQLLTYLLTHTHTHTHTYYIQSAISLRNDYQNNILYGYINKIYL